jgi:putative protease
MITEHCIIKNSAGRCDCQTPRQLSDRRGAAFPVAREFGCRNVIYNTHKLFLADRMEELAGEGLWGLRLLFTTESPRECVQVAQSYLGLSEYRPNGLTRGLYYRGVE